ncbi:11010_t:CDS:2 [Diversispora eburnea]|uniref:11010_t:CDS:1 n=1 Tax=Diversispora eburnea TaxID=1213867 RepID=A0A9N8ZGY9_9GLOM|nr:11010_t:CDS:2 [Diversispora eburnea]
MTQPTTAENNQNTEQRSSAAHVQSSSSGALAPNDLIERHKLPYVQESRRRKKNFDSYVPSGLGDTRRKRVMTTEISENYRVKPYCKNIRRNKLNSAKFHSGKASIPWANDEIELNKMARVEADKKDKLYHQLEPEKFFPRCFNKPNFTSAEYLDWMRWELEAFEDIEIPRPDEVDK